MLDEFKMGDAKQLRHTLLVTSFIGISFNLLFQNATGDFEFFGFKIPIGDISVIPKLIGFLIIYFSIALIIRYSSERFREKYKKGQKIAKEYTNIEIRQITEPDDSDIIERRYFSEYMKDSRLKQFVRVFGVLFLDIYFPLLLAGFAILKIFILS